MKIRLIALYLILVSVLSAKQPSVISSNSFILSQQLFTLQPSAADSELILSPNFENLELTPQVAEGSPATEFRMNVFNRAAAGNLIHYNFSIPGAWRFVLSSALSLSCSLVIERLQVNDTTLENVSLLSFNSQSGQFKILGSLPFTPLSNDTNVNIEQLRRSLRLGQNCEQGGLIFAGDTQAYRAVDNWTKLEPVSVPQGWQPQAISEDLNYVISQQRLYKYNADFFAYESIYQLPASPNYFIRNYQGRIIVSLTDLVAQVQNYTANSTNTTASNNITANSTIGNATSNFTNTTFNYTIANVTLDDLLNSNLTNNLTNATADVQQLNRAKNITILVLNHQATFPVQVVGQFQLPNNQFQEQVKVLISPKLTKVALITSSLNNSYQITAKDIDYASNTITDLIFQQEQRFLYTISTSQVQNEVDFNDYYIVVRNGSSYRHAQSGNFNFINITNTSSTNTSFDTSNNVIIINQTNVTTIINQTNVTIINQTTVTIINQTNLSTTVTTTSIHRNCLILPSQKPNSPCVLLPTVGQTLSFLPVQQVYQFVGSNVFLLQARSLLESFNDSQLKQFVKTYIDVSTVDRGVVINQYSFGNNGYVFVSFDYGNYVDTLRVRASVPYLSFTEPSYNKFYTQRNLLQWTYFTSSNSSNHTEVTFYSYENSTQTRYRQIHFQLPAYSELLFQNQNCMLVQSQQSIALYTYSAILETFVLNADLTTLLINPVNTGDTITVNSTNSSFLNLTFTNASSFNTTTTTLNLTTLNLTTNASFLNSSFLNSSFLNFTAFARSSSLSWKISPDSNRINFGSRLFVRQQTIGFKEVLFSQNITIVTMDQNLEYVLSNEGRIYWCDFKNDLFVPLKPQGLIFPLSSNLNSSFDRLVIYGAKASGYFIQAYKVDQQFNLILCLDYFAESFSEVNIYLSTELTKVFVLGQTVRSVSTNITTQNITNSTSINATIPSTVPLVPNNTIPVNQTNSTTTNSTPPNNSESVTQNEAEESKLQEEAESYIVHCINYNTQSSQQVTIPEKTIIDKTNTYVSLEQQFIYIRQKEYSVNNSLNNLRQFAYYFSQDLLAMQIFSRSLTAASRTSWQKTILLREQTRIFIMSEFLSESLSFRVRNIASEQISSTQAQINFQSTTYTSQIVRGDIRICRIGCADCGCSSCLPGYTYDLGSFSCRVCGGNCLSCQTGFPNVCTVCWSGAYLDASNSCQLCDSSCLTCQIISTRCTSCSPAYFLNPIFTCSPCPSNCLTCTDSSSCTLCGIGFFLTNYHGTPICHTCSTNCTTCNPENITECTACAQGLWLVDSQCLKCSKNCLKCSGDRCGLCASGYQLNDRGVCILKCELPCITCNDNKPNECLSCQFGSYLVNNTCQISLDCSLTNSCTSCCQGLGYFLVPRGEGAICQKCPKIGNCLQCDHLNTYRCAICHPGFYVDLDGVCSPCSSTCTSCLSDAICLGCQPGYTLVDNTEGVCLKCQAHCATCTGPVNYCTSCELGYILNGWRCVSDRYVRVSCTLNQNSTYILTHITLITFGILQILQENLTYIQNIVYTSVIDQTITFEYSLTTQTTTTTIVSQKLTQALTTETIPGTNLRAKQVQTTESCPFPSRLLPQVSSIVQPEQPTKLILGVTLGLTMLMMMLVIGIMVISKKRNRSCAALALQPVVSPAIIVYAHEDGSRLSQTELVQSASESLPCDETLKEN